MHVGLMRVFALANEFKSVFRGITGYSNERWSNCGVVVCIIGKDFITAEASDYNANL